MFSRIKNKTSVLSFALIIIVSLFLFWPQSGIDYVLDGHSIANNPFIKKTALYNQIFTTTFFEPTIPVKKTQYNYYRPILTLSFLPDYHFWRMEPFGSHILNIIFHAANALLLYAFSVILLKKRFKDNAHRLAACAALIFCILPAHEWVVRYVVGRGDLLQAFFCLGSLISLGLYLSKEIILYLFLSLSMFIFALLTRETALIFPVYTGLVTIFMTRNIFKTVRITGSFLLISLVYYVFRIAFFPIRGIQEGTIFSEVLSGTWMACVQLTHLIFPAVVKAILPFPIFIALLFSILILFVGIMARMFRQNEKEDIYFVLTMLAWLFTSVLSFIAARSIAERIGPVLSEHFLYFSSIGMALILALTLEKMRRPAKQILFYLIIIYFGSILIYNGSFWKSEQTIMRHVRSIDKGPSIAHEQLVMRYDDNMEEAMFFFNEAINDKVKSTWAKRIGNIYRKQGDYNNAVKYLEMAVRLNPYNLKALNELGVCFLENGYLKEGKLLLEQSLVVDAQNAETYRLLSTMFTNEGNDVKAKEMLAKAEYFDPVFKK